MSARKVRCDFAKRWTRAYLGRRSAPQGWQCYRPGRDIASYCTRGSRAFWVAVVPLPPQDETAPALRGLAVRPRAGRVRFTASEKATVLGRIELRAGRRWRARRDFDVRALRGRNVARLPLRGLEPGSYRVRLTAYDRADNRSRTLVRRFRLR